MFNHQYFVLSGRETSSTTFTSTPRRPTIFRGGGRREEEGEAEADEDERRRIKRKVVVVGDGGCGKTSLLQRFSCNSFSLQGFLPTVLDTYVTHVQVEQTAVELTVTDTARQEDYVDLPQPYSYPDTDVVIVCFAIDNPDSLENVRLTWIPEIRYFLGDVPVLLVGNKTDLRTRGEGDSTLHAGTASSRDLLDFPDCSPSAVLIKQDPVKKTAARKLAGEVGAVGYWETSALLGQGVAEVFQSTCRVTLKGPQPGKKVRGFLKRSCLQRAGMMRH
ncbi:hypothetical protein ACOMHN_008576 [Nucella lapillus]